MTPPALTETGACTAGLTAKQFGRMLLWQSVMGVTAPLVHCAHSSVRGPRAYEYPPNYGPNDPIWPDMNEVHRKLIEVQNVTHDARQIAPVAILWTVRSFNARQAMADWQHDPTGIRRSMLDTLAGCLDQQVGTHFIDEADLWDAPIADGEITLGRARYTHVLIPQCTVLHERTITKLHELQDAGVAVMLTGDPPSQQQTDTALQPLDMGWCEQMTIAEAVSRLPCLIDLQGDATDIRCTAWIAEGTTPDADAIRLLISLNEQPFEARFDDRSMTLEPGEVYRIAP